MLELPKGLELAAGQMFISVQMGGTGMESQVGQCGLLQQPLVVFGDKTNHEADLRPEARLFWYYTS